jgi:hypothetical protein
MPSLVTISLTHKVRRNMRRLIERKKSVPRIGSTRQHDIAINGIAPNEDSAAVKSEFHRQAHGLATSSSENLCCVTHVYLQVSLLVYIKVYCKEWYVSR